MSAHRGLNADDSIRQTDFDAARARQCAAEKGYVSDPFINNFVPRARSIPPGSPVINIGTFLRSTAIDRLVDQWLSLAHSQGEKAQIVSLGAGSDTRFWRIASGPKGNMLSKYIELDFPQVTGKKAMTIRKSQTMSALLGDPADVQLSHGGTGLHSARYHLLPVDLRAPPTDTLDPLLSSVLDSSLPTLLLFECVLVYMTPEASTSLIKWFTTYFSDPGPTRILGAIVYEMFGLDDPFGRVMRTNMQSRGLTLPGAEPYQRLASLPERFTKHHNFTLSKALTLHIIGQEYISPMERNRIFSLERLDEVEELALILSHYAITWGLRVFNNSPLPAWSEWGLAPFSQKEEDIED